MASQSLNHLFAVIVVVTLTTFATRIAPFLIFRKSGPSASVRYLGAHFPLMITTILVVYSFKDLVVGQPNVVMASVLGGLATTALQIFAKNALLSITAGVLVYALCNRLI